MVRRALRGALAAVTVLAAAGVAVAGLAVTVPPIGDLLGPAVTVPLTEWSLLLIPPGLVVLLLAWFSRWAGMLRAGAVAAVLAVLAIVLSGLPAVRGGIEAADHGIRFDPLEYLAGSATSVARRPDRTITYAEPAVGVPLALDVWLPPGSAGSASVGVAVGRTGASAGTDDGNESTGRIGVIRVPGARWPEGDRTRFPRWSAWLSDSGHAVFDLEYRRGPDGGPAWPEAPGDIACAVGWLGEHADEYGVDPDRIVLLGAGEGALVAMSAAYGGAEPAADCTVAGSGSGTGTGTGTGSGSGSGSGTPPGGAGDRLAVAGLIALYPTAMVPGGGDVADLVASTAPPTLLVHGAADSIAPVAGSRRLTDALRRSDIRHRHVEITYADHGFDLNFGGFASQIGRAAIDRFLQDRRTE